MDNIIGRKLDGRYEIHEIIGVGGMAVVYKAYDSIDDRIVAVKVLKEEYLKNDEFRRRFKNESKAVAVLSHPNIVKVFDVSFGDKIQYIVMEYIDGITLKEYIEQQSMLTWKEAVHFSVQILRALQHAHERGIVHRDIKPQNIMMLEDGTIKVTDFGIARFAQSETKTMTDKAIGSVHYISPEQARGGHTDEKSDIYSVGVMMYEMLTGKLPFEAENAVSVAIMQMQEDPKLLRNVNPEIPEGLEDITLHAMQKDPAQRYKSAAAMLEDIERFKRNPSIHFQYKYFVDESPTKYVDVIKEVKGGNSIIEDKFDKNSGAVKKSNLLPILAGVTAALVIVVVGMILVTLAIRGVFSGNTQVTVPNLVGQQLQAAQADTANNIIQIVESNTEYNSKPAGQIVDQTPAANTKVSKNYEVKVTVSKGPNLITIPDVYGQEKTQAEATLQSAGFTNVNEQQQYDENTAIGYIISTQPERGQQAAPGDAITVLISMGPSPSTLQSVPDLSGLTQDLATRKIQDAGLIAGTPTQEYSSTVPTGYVTRQDPVKNTQVPAKTTINFWISKGPQPASAPTTVTVPLLVGISVDDAEANLTQNKLKWTLVADYDSTYPVGVVESASEDKGTTVPIGTNITLYVSTAPDSSTSGSSSDSSSDLSSSTSTQ
jgi:serine/threonine-protein kinase